ncbi:hypothetical protein [Streptosporangium amethystogenes]|uniref:hypothetical protein n=1 Tax=Streptosporangium amethystogenes TaxID=2002 RepID=UPI0012F88F8F|nr:hypothetical protein [Streptosporangium amethystogenes]
MVNDQKDLFPGLWDEQQGLNLSPEIAVESVESQQTATVFDTPQGFEQGTSFQVRDAFEELVRRDLLGPWGGETKEPPRGRLFQVELTDPERAVDLSFL